MCHVSLRIVVRATFGSRKRALNQHRQNYPLATVRMSSIEVLHEMFIVSSDPLLALVTKSAQRLTPHRPGGTDTAAPGTRHFLARRTDRFPAGLRRGRCNMIPRKERPALRGSGMERSQASLTPTRSAPSCGLGWPSTSPPKWWRRASAYLGQPREIESLITVVSSASCAPQHV